jgi:hypothetical protein
VWLPAKATLNRVHPAAVLPAALAGLWPDDDSPVKRSTLCAWFDGTQAFDEIAQPGYPPEKRPIPKADYKVVHQAVAQAVARGDIWLVFGNDSILGEKPTDLQLDPDASLLRPPARLRTMDLLPGALAASWSGEPETTTVGKLYAELKAQRGKPWPTRQFIEVLNEAVNQGMLVRPTGGADFTSVKADAERELRVPATSPSTQPPTPPSSAGANETTEVALDLAQLQDFVEDSAAVLTKMLAGAAPEFLVKIRLKGKKPESLAEANEVLKKIREGVASVRRGHYAVVLSKNVKHSAWLLFILTHELGHIVQGHVSRDGVLVDELVDRSSRDKEEKAANAFALELLTGAPELRVLPMGPGRSARGLARAALDACVHEQIDPSHIVLNCAYQMGGDFFALANAALRLLEPHTDAVALVRSRMIAYLDKTKLPKDVYDFILRVTRASQSRDLLG